MKSEKKVFFSSIWYIISNFVLKGIIFITVPIFSRIMSKSEFGNYSNFITWLHLLMVIVSFNLYASINRARLDFPQQLDQYCSSILILGTAITSGFYFAVSLNLSFFENIFSMKRFYIHIMFLYLLVQPAMEIFQVKQRVLFRYKASVSLSIFSTLITTICSVLLVINMEDKFKGRVIGYVFPLILLNIMIYIYFLVRGKSCNPSYCKYAFLYSWPFVPHLVATYMLSASDRIMITRLCGIEYTALYTIACNCMSISTLFLTSLNNAIAPWIFDRLENKEEQEIKRLTIPYCFVFFALIQFAILIAPEILWILGGTQYEIAKSIVVPLMISVLLQFAYCLYVNLEQYSRKTWAIAFGTSIASGVNIILNFFLLPQYGYEVAAYTTLIGYILLFIIHYVFVRIIGYKDIYNDKVVFLMIVAAIVEQPLMIFLYHYTCIRFIVLAAEVLCVFIFLNRKKERIRMFIINK